jgi:hypothetical protein
MPAHFGARRAAGNRPAPDRRMTAAGRRQKIESEAIERPPAGRRQNHAALRDLKFLWMKFR